MNNRVIVGVAACLLAVVVPGVAEAQNLTKQQKKALALTPEHFQQTATVKDDSLELSATVTTQNGFQEKRGLLGMVWNDNFLRAIIDKKTGETVFQVYQWITYEGDWRFYDQVNYETATGPESAKLTRIDQSVSSCSGARYGGGCTLSEHFAFQVPEPLLRTIASKAGGSEPVAWRFKFKGRTAEDWTDGMLPAEVAGFLQAVDEVRARFTKS